jgi:hypothetical protein
MLETRRESSFAGRNWKGGTAFRNSMTASVTTDVDEERVDKAAPEGAILSKAGDFSKAGQNSALLVKVCLNILELL